MVGDWNRRGSGIVVPRDHPDRIGPVSAKVAVHVFVRNDALATSVLDRGFVIPVAADSTQERAEAYLEKFGDVRGAILQSHSTQGWSAQPFSPEGGPFRIATRLDGCTRFVVGPPGMITASVLTEFEGTKQDRVDLLFGSPACESMDNGRAGDKVMDPARSEVLEFARLVAEVKPRMFLFEGVVKMAGLKTTKNKPVVDVFAEIIGSAGWTSAQSVKRSLLAKPAAAQAYRQLTGQKPPRRQRERDVDVGLPETPTPVDQPAPQTEQGELDLFSMSMDPTSLQQRPAETPMTLF